ncbi:MAG: N-formylglutamate deformylase [Candidatus Eremiobacteraeota bacterium]|nr:N-formylglutamate deformylase [Candidatus Eremiobacteraeota bacterium]
MRLFEIEPGDAPLVLSFPHAGSAFPPDVSARLTTIGRTSIDTDWNVDRLYAFASRLGIGTIRANVSRYVVDLNRDPNGAPLYPGARTTGVMPTETFEGDALYAPGDEPTAGEISERIATYWSPYHAALSDALARVRQRHGYALLVDGHSIWGRLPLLFDGELPDVNLGTNRGASCAPEMTQAVAQTLATPYPSLVVDGRFTGGYITRTYGAPSRNVHALQIELNERTYLEDGSRTATDDGKAATLSAALRRACEALLAWTPAASPVATGVT